MEELVITGHMGNLVNCRHIATVLMDILGHIVRQVGYLQLSQYPGRLPPDITDAYIKDIKMLSSDTNLPCLKSRWPL